MSSTSGVTRRLLWSVVLRHKATAAAIAFGVGFLVVSLVLALGQWDGERITFPAKTGLAVWLEPGEQRIIYLTPDESEPLNFDFYPSDFACSARGPGGQVAVRPDYHHRSLDLWHDYWSVGSVVADVAGLYRISCSVHDDPLLVLAAPARFTVGWAEPVGLVGVGILLGSALIHTALAIVR